MEGHSLLARAEEGRRAWWLAPCRTRPPNIHLHLIIGRGRRDTGRERGDNKGGRRKGRAGQWAGLLVCTGWGEAGITRGSYVGAREGEGGELEAGGQMLGREDKGGRYQERRGLFAAKAAVA